MWYGAVWYDMQEGLGTAVVAGADAAAGAGASAGARAYDRVTSYIHNFIYA